MLLGRWWQPALGVLRVLGASIAAEINGYVKEKEGTRWPIKHPVLDALRATDWCALRDQAIEAHDMGVRQARVALCPPLPPPYAPLDTTPCPAVYHPMLRCLSPRAPLSTTP